MFGVRLPDGRTLEERVENEDVGLMIPGRRVFVRGVRGVRGVPWLERLRNEATLSEGTAIGSLLVWCVLVSLTLALSRKREASP